jgi:hypothetical protein
MFDDQLHQIVKIYYKYLHLSQHTVMINHSRITRAKHKIYHVSIAKHRHM